MRRLAPNALVLIFVWPSPQGAAAQDFPLRPITMVVPFAAGGATDALARVMADADVRKRFVDLGLEVQPPQQQSAAALGTLQRAEIEKYGNYSIPLRHTRGLAVEGG